MVGFIVYLICLFLLGVLGGAVLGLLKTTIHNREPFWSRYERMKRDPPPTGFRRTRHPPSFSLSSIDPGKGNV